MTQKSKFQKGDKVAPISKSYSGPLSSSGIWKHAQEIRQKFLYVNNFKTEEGRNVIVCSYNPDEGGDYFMEEDLIFYVDMNDTFELGEIVEIRLDPSDVWAKRIFIAKIPNSEAPFLCVANGLDSLDARGFAAGKKFGTNAWKECRKVPKWEPKTMELNDEYQAIIYEHIVKVGCQTFSFEAIHALNENVLKAEKHNKE